MLIIWFVFPNFFQIVHSNPASVQMLMGTFSTALILLGAFLGTYYIAKTYVIKNTQLVVKRATIWFAVLLFVLAILPLLFPDPAYPFILTLFIVSTLFEITFVAIVYYVGVKFLPTYIEKNAD